MANVKQMPSLDTTSEILQFSSVSFEYLHRSSQNFSSIRGSLSKIKKKEFWLSHQTPSHSTEEGRFPLLHMYICAYVHLETGTGETKKCTFELNCT